MLEAYPVNMANSLSFPDIQLEDHINVTLRIYKDRDLHLYCFMAEWLC